MKTIGIKLADGSFYPVLQEDTKEQKQLDLTTAHNNQTRVMVDMYRSATCSMDDAEYVDTLQIDNLIAHPNGQPDISFTVSLDDDNNLFAKIVDEETGAQSKTTITLVSRTIEERLITDDYEIKESTESMSNSLNDLEEKEKSSENAGGGLLAAAMLINEQDAAKEAAEVTDTTEETAVESIDDFGDITLDETSADDQPIDITSNLFRPDDLDIPDFSMDDNTQNESTESADPFETDGLDSFENEPLDTAETDINTTDSLDTDLPDFGDMDLGDDSFGSTESADPFETDDLDSFGTDSMDTLETENNTTDSLDTDLPDFGDMDLGDDSFGSTESVNPFETDDVDPFAMDTDTNLDSSSDTDISSDDIFADDSLEDNSEAIGGGISFTNLYDDVDLNADDKNYDGQPKKKNLTIIVIILVSILLFAAVLSCILIIPSKTKGKKKKAKQTVAIETVVEETIPEFLETPVVPEEEKTPVAEPEVEEPKITEPEVEEESNEIPQAKEDEIVVIEEAEKVVPELPPVEVEKPKDIFYKIKWGDTLWDIANTYYKNPWKYKYLARYNGIKNPDAIVSGTVIAIPVE